MLSDCRRQGWRISFFYVWLPRPEDSIARVARRVSEGGHNIPTEAIYRRFKTGLWNALNLYLPLADRAEFHDNSDRRRILVAQKFEGSPLLIVDSTRWAQMMEVTDEKHDIPGDV
jgi:predicted ABC-type ATPase